MPIARFQLPDGRVARFEVPDGTTPEQAQAAMASYMQKPAEKPYDPTEGMGTGERLLAGAGKAFYDLGRGVGQLFGAVSDKDVEEARKRDAALMATTAGKVGNFGGNVAAALPTMFIPGANTLTGAALIGAGQGALQPIVGGESRLKNAAIGAGAGAGGLLAGRALLGAYQGGKALAEPFTQSGRDKIAGRMLTRYADDASAIRGLPADAGAPTATGAQLTVPELTKDRGLAQLMDSLRSIDPQIANRIGSRMSANNAARVGTLESLGGTAAERDAAEAARAAASGDLYSQATGATYQLDRQLANLLNRPAMKQAMARAQALAENNGRPFTFTTGASAVGEGVPRAGTKQITGQGLQDLKMAMDEMLTDPASGFTGSAGNTIKSLRGQLVDWMERANPDFKAARTSYAAASKPLNGMDVGEYIANKATSNATDLGGNPTIYAERLAGMLNDPTKTIRAATGRKELSDLAQVMSPEQLAKLTAVRNEANLAAAVAKAGNGPGSATAQRMASQNILRQLVGPTGLPNSWAESALANTVVGKPLNLVYGGVAEPKIQQALADALLDPNIAKSVLQSARSGGYQLPNGLAAQLLLQSLRLTPSTLAVTGQR